MPELPTGAGGSKHQESYRTTADLVEALNKKFPSTSLTAGPGGQDAENKAPTETAASAASGCNSLKAQMMAEFRRARHENGMKTTTLVEPQVESRAKDPKLSFVAQPQSTNYIRTVNAVREKRSDFDYYQFVGKGYNDGGVLSEAILADALSEYDPDN